MSPLMSYRISLAVATVDACIALLLAIKGDARFALLAILAGLVWAQAAYLRGKTGQE